MIDTINAEFSELKKVEWSVNQHVNNLRIKVISHCQTEKINGVQHSQITISYETLQDLFTVFAKAAKEKSSFMLGR